MVSGGTLRRMTLPSLVGVMPTSDFKIALSISPSDFGSHGCISISFASGAVLPEKKLPLLGLAAFDQRALFGGEQPVFGQQVEKIAIVIQA